MDAVASGGFISPGETFAAYGEVVWSWRRDPGVKLPGRAQQRRWQKRPLTGESTYKPSNHCAGKAGMSRLYLSNPCALFIIRHCTRCCGRSRRPAFPAPSVQRGSKRDGKTLGTIDAAGIAFGCLKTESVKLSGELARDIIRHRSRDISGLRLRLIRPTRI